MRTLLNYCAIIQNLYSSPAAINVSEGLHLKQLLILYSSLSVISLSLIHSCVLSSLKLGLVQPSLPATSVGKIESDVCNSIPQIEKMMTCFFFLSPFNPSSLFFSWCFERWPWLQAFSSPLWCENRNDGLHNLCSGLAFLSCLYWFPSKRLLWRPAPTSRCSSSQPTFMGISGRRPPENMWTSSGRRER